MAEKHPDELALLAYAEDELGADARGALDAHLAACAACAEDVRRLEAGREALRAAPLLELPEERRAAILAGLPDRPERRERRWSLPPLRRRLLVAAPVAAAALVAVVLAATQLAERGSDPGAAGDAAEVAEEGAGAERAGADETDAAAEDAGAAQPQTLEAAPVVRVAGPPAAVVRALAREGIEARVVDGAVVAAARPGEVEAALAGRARGSVEVRTGE